MGSYISIVNDTTDPWQCPVGPDTVALKVAAIAVASIGALVTVLATAGSAAPVIAAIGASGTISVAGVSTTALATAAAGAKSAASVASVVGGVSGFGLSIANKLADVLTRDGYHLIAAGGTYKWGKKSLSLWQQATCVKTVIVSESHVRIETLYMRPIFTGATANSNRDYMIKNWLEKKGTEHQEIVASRANEKRSMSDGDAFNQSGARIVHFYANGTNSYQAE